VARLRAAGCVFAEDEARLLLETATGGDLEALVGRRVAGEPLEYVLGWVEFDGQRWFIEPGVFVPRRRTELMVREAVALGAGRSDPVVVDVCCGCGAVGAAVLRRLGRGRLVAADVDPTAVRCAARNVEPLGGTVLLGDLYDPLPTEPSP
jgi:release factor glutamine methyltransferase